jgi:DNA topoisomerase VI subunit B
MTARQDRQNGRDWVTVVVTDTGIGMTPEQMSKLAALVLASPSAAAFVR